MPTPNIKPLGLRFKSMRETYFARGRLRKRPANTPARRVDGPLTALRWGLYTSKDGLGNDLVLDPRAEDTIDLSL